MGSEQAALATLDPRDYREHSPSEATLQHGRSHLSPRLAGGRGGGGRGGGGGTAVQRRTGSGGAPRAPSHPAGHVHERCVLAEAWPGVHVIQLCRPRGVPPVRGREVWLSRVTEGDRL